ncbi:MAG: hypothetical protein Q7S42_04440 [Candidatus Omnitrophota bacterium]|nr:hypothetical protein [Candidatus Omnitrophota bacterium]
MKKFKLVAIVLALSLFLPIMVSAEGDAIQTEETGKIGLASQSYLGYLKVVSAATSFEQVKKYFSKEALETIKGQEMEDVMLKLLKVDLENNFVIVDEKKSGGEAFLTLKSQKAQAEGLVINHADGSKEATKLIMNVTMKEEDGMWKIVKQEIKEEHVFKKPTGQELQENKEYEKTLDGVINALELKELLIDVVGYTVEANDKTIFEGIGSFADLKVGDKVHIIYYIDLNGKNIAKHLQILK